MPHLEFSDFGLNMKRVAEGWSYIMTEMKTDLSFFSIEYRKVTFWHFCELAKSLGCFFAPTGALIVTMWYNISLAAATFSDFHSLH